MDLDSTCNSIRRSMLTLVASKHQIHLVNAHFWNIIFDAPIRPLTVCIQLAWISLIKCRSDNEKCNCDAYSPELA